MIVGSEGEEYVLYNMLAFNTYTCVMMHYKFCVHITSCHATLYRLWYHKCNHLYAAILFLRITHLHTTYRIKHVAKKRTSETIEIVKNFHKGCYSN